METADQTAEIPRNVLSSPQPDRRDFPTRWWWLFALFLLCLAPRLWMAYRLDIPCPDGVFYINLTKAHDAGESSDDHAPYSLNVYPLILSSIHKLGLDYQQAAQGWGVLAGCLTVLPLFGWLRRMFDDRIALISCLLYSSQPQLIEWSPDVLRGPTYWLFMTTAIYFTWRGLMEARVRWFFASGVATALAFNTRFEGWFLLAPSLLWSLARFRALRRERKQVPLGLAAHLAAYPAVLVCLALAYGEGEWSGSVFHRLRLVEMFLASADSPEADTGPDAQHAAAPLVLVANRETAREPDGDSAVPKNKRRDSRARQRTERRPQTTSWLGEPLTRAKAAYIMNKKIARALSPWFGILTMLGMVIHRRLLIRSDVAPLTLFCLAVSAAMWVHLMVARDSSDRYFLPATIVMLPLTTFGLLRVAKWAKAALEYVGRRGAAGVMLALARRKAAVLAVLTVATAIIGWCDALSRTDSGRVGQAELGRWLHEEYGPGRRIVGNSRWRLMNYYAQGEFQHIPLSVNGKLRGGLPTFVANQRPDIVVLSGDRTPRNEVALLLDCYKSLGLKRVPEHELPDSVRPHAMVFVRVQTADAAQIDYRGKSRGCKHTAATNDPSPQ